MTGTAQRAVSGTMSTITATITNPTSSVALMVRARTLRLGTLRPRNCNRAAAQVARHASRNPGQGSTGMDGTRVAIGKMLSDATEEALRARGAGRDSRI
jgi:hypothetical protein